MLEIEYAKEFGCHPQDVSEIVTVESWNRWLLAKKAQASREANESFGVPGSAKNMTPDQMRLMGWAMVDGEY
jgi:hypothetical protein